MVTFFDIDSAFNFVSSAEYGMNSALLCRDTGQIYYQSDLGDSDELPNDIENDDRYIDIPHKNDLDLGIELVREFMFEHLPEKAGRVETYFQRKGAYSRFKELLGNCNALEQWYEFELVKTESALRGWCAENHIKIEVEGAGDTVGASGERAAKEY